MYAHQVIEDLQNYSQYLTDTQTKQVINLIIQSQKFYIGDFHGASDMFPRKQSSNILLEDPTRIKMPYDLTYIDGDLIIPDRGFFVEKTQVEKDLLIRKYGKIPSDDDIKKYTKHAKFSFLVNRLSMNKYYFFTFMLIHDPDLNKKRWCVSPTISVFCVADEKITQNDLDILGIKNQKRIVEEWSLAEFIISKLSPNEELQFKATANQTLADTISVIFVFVLFLSSKNITSYENSPPIKLNKKRKKSGKQELFTYKTLVIKPTGKKQESQAAKGLWDNRVHLCRGHFKEYTTEKPLFGRVTGRFWWQPSVRGNNKNGIVMKDYEVQAA